MGPCQHTWSSIFGQKGSELKSSIDIPIELYVSWFEWNICEYNLPTLEHPAIPIFPSTLVKIGIYSVSYVFVGPLGLRADSKDYSARGHFGN